jgi:hypothetical protein
MTSFQLSGKAGATERASMKVGRLEALQRRREQIAQEIDRIDDQTAAHFNDLFKLRVAIVRASDQAFALRVSTMRARLATLRGVRS